MQMVIKIVVAVLGFMLALSLLKNIIGLIIGLGLAAILFVGTTRLLEKK